MLIVRCHAHCVQSLAYVGEFMSSMLKVARGRKDVAHENCMEKHSILEDSNYQIMIRSNEFALAVCIGQWDLTKAKLETFG